MTSQTTFYLSQILGNNLYSADGSVLGKIRDLLIDLNLLEIGEARPVRPEVIAVKVKRDQAHYIYDFSSMEILKSKGGFKVISHDIEQLSPDYLSNVL